MINRLRNPILDSQMKIRMRGIGAFISMLIYILVLLVTVLLSTSVMFLGQSNILNTMRQGLNIYYTLAYLQFFLIILLTPALTAGLISSERERQTLDLLLCSRQGAFRIILGKLLSGTLFVMLLVICSLPMMSLVYMVGDLSLWHVLQLLIFLFVCIFAVGSMGIFFSTLLKRTTGATVITYCVVLAYGIGTLAGGIAHTVAVMAARQLANPLMQPESYVSPLTYTNPFMGLAMLLQEQMGTLGDRSGSSGVGMITELIRMVTGRYYDTPVMEGGGVVPFWVITLLSMLGLAMLFLLGSMWLLRKDRKNTKVKVSRRQRKQEAAQESAT